MKNTNKKGFTIVELVIVIAVIAILAAVLIPTFQSVIDNANKSSAMQEARNALTTFMSENNAKLDSTKDYYFAVDDDGDKTADYYFIHAANSSSKSLEESTSDAASKASATTKATTKTKAEYPSVTILEATATK